MITIHMDYVDGTEVSYAEGLALGDNFTTNCLTFFSNDLTTADNVVVAYKSGMSIDRNELMSNQGFRYTSKHMRSEHNLCKMLIAGAFVRKAPGGWLASYNNN